MDMWRGERESPKFLDRIGFLALRVQFSILTLSIMSLLHSRCIYIYKNHRGTMVYSLIIYVLLEDFDYFGS